MSREERSDCRGDFELRAQSVGSCSKLDGRSAKVRCESLGATLTAPRREEQSPHGAEDKPKEGRADGNAESVTKCLGRELIIDEGNQGYEEHEGDRDCCETSSPEEQVISERRPATRWRFGAERTDCKRVCIGRPLLRSIRARPADPQRSARSWRHTRE